MWGYYTGLSANVIESKLSETHRKAGIRTWEP